MNRGKGAGLGGPYICLTQRFCSLPFFLYSIVLLSSLDKEMTSSSTVPPKLYSFYRTGQNTAALLFCPIPKDEINTGLRLKSTCMDKIVPARAPEKVTGQKANELRFPCCHTPRHFFSPRSCFIFASPEVSRNRGGAWGRQVAKSMQYPLAHSPL